MDEEPREIIKSFNKQRCDVGLTDAIDGKQNTTDNTIINEKSLLVKQFNGLNIQVYGTYEEPLFKAKDIGDLLGIKDIKSTLRDFDKDEVHSMHLIDSLGREQETNMLKEQGLYKILMISRKPIAKQFQKWVFDVIKQIRLKGKYDLEKKLEERNKQIEETTADIEKFKVSSSKLEQKKLLLEDYLKTKNELYYINYE